MQALLVAACFLLCFTAQYRATALTEHKVPYVHNIVLYPDKHSWCKTTAIKQIVAYPGCSSVEIDNHVCVGACFSYNIPRTLPSAPGEVITPYCDSCQPVDYVWKDVKLTCSDESGEEDATSEMTKRVQVITNCTCTSCTALYGSKATGSHDRDLGVTSKDVPELMSLMLERHQTKSGQSLQQEETEDEEDDEEKEEVAEETTTQRQHTELPVHHNQEHEKESDRDNLVEDEDDEEQKRTKPPKEETPEEDEQEDEEEDEEDEGEKEDKLEILQLTKHTTPVKGELEAEAHSEHKHYEVGPHHSLVLKQDTPTSGQDHEQQQPHRHHKKDESEVVPSLLQNQFKIHDNEEYLDQIAVESVQREKIEQKVLMVPDLIYKGQERSEGGEDTAEVGGHHPHHKNQQAHEGSVQLSTIYTGKEGSEQEARATMLEVQHHHLQPAMEGVQLTYKTDSKTE